MKLPTTLRPSDSEYRECLPGKDLPSWFMDDLKAIDEKLYLVYHPFALMWDNLMNQYTGELEDPRFSIHREHGQECWGWVTTDSNGAPIPEGAWHVWRLWDPHGYTHVVRVDSKEDSYLKTLLDRLYLQGNIRDKEGEHAWSKHLAEEQSIEQQKRQAEADEGFEAVQAENECLTRAARDNMARGVVKPTNPMVEKIVSYGGQKNHTATRRPADDADAGLKAIEHL